jgi:hypothetical protein
MVSKIESISGIEKVISIECVPADFTDRWNVSMLLQDGGYIKILNLRSWLDCRKTLIAEIGNYRMYEQYFDVEKRVKVFGTLVSITTIQTKLTHKLHSLKDVIQHYNEIEEIIAELRPDSFVQQ